MSTRERDREREKEGERKTDRETEREKRRGRERQREREKEGGRGRVLANRRKVQRITDGNKGRQAEKAFSGSFFFNFYYFNNEAFCFNKDSVLKKSFEWYRLNLFCYLKYLLL